MAAFTAARERALWRLKNESLKQYPYLTRFGAPAEPTPCVQNAPKLCKPRDLARNLEDPKSGRRASTLAPTTLQQKRASEFAAAACVKLRRKPTKNG